MEKADLFILTDFPKFPTLRQTEDGRSVQASTRLAHLRTRDGFKLWRDIRRADLLLIQTSTSILGFAFLFWLFPFLKRPIIAVDLILRTPHTRKQRWMAALKRFLLKRVDHFVLYFKDLRGYTTYYGIPDYRCSYVAFKSNMKGNPRLNGTEAIDSEEYVFSAGRSLRDFDTLFKALSQLQYPAAIPQPDFSQLRRHGARFTWPLNQLPKNLVLLPDDGSPGSWLRNLSRAKVVVIPTLADNLCASGIGTYLDAMRLRKCVVITDGPGVSDLLRDEVLIVPPENPEALAEAIKQAWENSDLRSQTALRGYNYVTALGGEPELMDRLFHRVLEWVKQRSELAQVHRRN